MASIHKTGVAIATAAAALFAAGASLATSVQAAEDGTVKCAGINTQGKFVLGDLGSGGMAGGVSGHA